MKRIFAILFFICLAFKPAYNIGFVSYYKLNINTIVQKYCVNKSQPKLKCNGKCYLKKKLAQTQISTTEDSFEKIVLESFSEIFFPVFFEKNTVDFKIFNTSVVCSPQETVSFSVKEWILSTTTPPPDSFNFS